MLGYLDEGQIRQGVTILRNKGIVAFPTDTLYGLGVDIFALQSIELLLRVKGRSILQPLPILVSSVQDLNSLAVDIPWEAWVLAEWFWPGPLTMVLRKSTIIHDLLTGGRETVAVRMPNHVIPIALINGLGGPITGTSANRTGGVDLLKAEDVHRELGNEVDLIIGKDIMTNAQPSTIVDLTGKPVDLLRQGALPFEKIVKVLWNSSHQRGLS